jgi:hypothetical protein
MRALILLFVAIAAYAQTYTSVVVSNITSSSAMISWTTSFDTQDYIKYGLTPSYGSFTNSGVFSTQHQWFLSGLQPNTLYNYQLCNTDSSCDATNRTFTTLARGPVHPAPPALPTTTPVMPAMPTVWGTSTVITSCEGLQPAINAAAAADGNANHLIEIPASFDCGFEDGAGAGFQGGSQINLPNKSGANPTGAGWIVIRTQGADLPENTRVDALAAAKFATLRTPPYIRERVGVPTAGTCELGRLYWDLLISPWGLRRCSIPGTNTYEAVPRTDFSGPMPTTCAIPDSWYRKTDENPPSSMVYCTAAGRPIRVNIGETLGGGSFGFAENAHHYRFSLLNFAPIPIFGNTAPAWIQGNFRTDFTYQGAVFDASLPTVNNLIFDRLNANYGYPYRLGMFIYSGADNVIVANSSIVASYFVPDSGQAIACNACTTFAISFAGGSTGLISNNYIEAPGITIFSSEDTQKAWTDWTVRGNTITAPAKYRKGTPENTALCPGVDCWFPARHLFEMKRGQRVLVEGNTFEDGFSSGNNQGHPITLSPRPGSTNLPLTDVTIQSNYFGRVPNGLYLIGHNDRAPQAITGARFAVRNNLFAAIDGTLVAQGQGPREGAFLRIAMGTEDIIVTNNTVRNLCTGSAPMFAGNLFQPAIAPSSGFTLHNNINWGCQVDSPFFYVGTISNSGGTAGLNIGWPTTNGWSMAGNVSPNVGGGLTGVGYPAGNYWPANVAAVGFRGATDWRLRANSTFQPSTSPGFAGAAIGHDPDVLTAASGVTYNASYVRTGQTTGVIRWTAPTTAACTVGRSLSPAFTSETRVTASGGSRRQSVNFTGLTAGTQYYVRIYCSQISTGTFTTAN